MKRSGVWEVEQSDEGYQKDTDAGGSVDAKTTTFLCNFKLWSQNLAPLRELLQTRSLRVHG